MNAANQGARKKVMFLITKATQGGAQKYVYDLATHMPQFDVSVAYGTAGALIEKLAQKNILTHQIPSLGRDVAIISDIRSFFEILSLLRRIKPDVLHLNSSKAAALGALAARLAGVRRIIFTVHGWPFKENRNFLWKFLIYVISYKTALMSHATIVVSEADKELGEKMWGVRSKIKYIPLGIETPIFLAREDASAALSISTQVRRVVTIAELTANKGIRFALGAMAQLKMESTEIMYYIIGDGERREELSHLAVELGISDRVVFLGFIENASEYLRAFDVFLLPSIKEGMPYVLLEAAAAGLPIVMTSAVDITLPHCRLVPLGDSTEIARALTESKNESLGEISNQYPLSTMLEKTIALY